MEKISVKKFTKIVIRLTCTRTQLFQECRVVRKGDDYVEAHLKEFGGSRFRIRISLQRETVTLLSPNYSWWPEANTIPALVMKTIEDMLSARRSYKTLILTRSVIDIAA